MSRLQDVTIYRGRNVVATASRLELGAKSPFLLELLSSIKICDGCKDQTVLVFPEEDEDEDNLKEAIKQLSHFSRGFTILERQSKYETNNFSFLSVITWF